MTNDCNFVVVFPELPAVIVELVMWLFVCLSSRMVSCNSDWTTSRETSSSSTEKSKEPPQPALHIISTILYIFCEITDMIEKSQQYCATNKVCNNGINSIYVF